MIFGCLGTFFLFGTFYLGNFVVTVILVVSWSPAQANLKLTVQLRLAFSDYPASSQLL